MELRRRPMSKAAPAVLKAVGEIVSHCGPLVYRAAKKYLKK
jgi:hypothetical protein